MSKDEGVEEMDEMASPSDSGRGTPGVVSGAARPTIAVWGHYHGRNLGDELVVSLLVDAIRGRLPDAHVVGVSMRPEDTRRRHGIEAFPIAPLTNGGAQSTATAEQATPGGGRGLRRLATSVPGARQAYGTWRRMARLVREIPFVVRSYRFLRGVDLVVVAGSGQLLDEWKGPWGHPYTTLRWAALARLARVPVSYPSVGAGPLDARLSRRMVRSAIAHAQSITVRDEESGALLTAIGVRRELRVCPDMAYAWAVPASFGSRSTADARDRRVTGVNVMAHQDPRYWPRGREERYQAYIAKMAEVVRLLVARGDRVHLFSSQSPADGPPTADLLHHLGALGHDGEHVVSSVGATETEHELVELLAGCDAVVAGRYHSLLLPMAMGIPVVGLAYNPKTHALLGAGGLGDCCFDIDAFTPDDVVSALDRLEADWSIARQEPLARHVEESRAAVEAQFDALFQPLRGPRAPAVRTPDRRRAAA